MIMLPIALWMFVSNKRLCFSSDIDCLVLGNPANGLVTLTATTHTSVATYSCNPGYSRIGDDTRTCQSSGDWSGSEPMCIGKS